jgi:hypothetical protein
MYFRHMSRSEMGPISFLSNGYRGLLPGAKAASGLMLTSRLHPVPELRLREAVPVLLHTPSSHCAYLRSTGTTYTCNHQDDKIKDS